MSQFQTKKFKDLKDKWYQKLKDKGFDDIEQDENNLKEWESSIFSRYNPHTADSKAEYYTMAGQFLNSHKFENKREQFIWENHAEGLSLDDIVKKLKSNNYKSQSRSSVHLIIKKITQEMMLKHGVIKPKRPDSN